MDYSTTTNAVPFTNTIVVVNVSAITELVNSHTLTSQLCAGPTITFINNVVNNLTSSPITTFVILYGESITLYTSTGIPITITNITAPWSCYTIYCYY